ncbi:hypothetical protein V6C27_06335 [Peptococcaceae bacterium 1198_IL3148]
MGVLDKRQPTFIQFRVTFLETVKKITGSDGIDAYTEWQDVGDLETRKAILNKVKQSIITDFGFEPVLVEGLYDYQGPVESVANQVHHVFSTMYLVERINAKHAAGLN